MHAIRVQVAILVIYFCINDIYILHWGVCLEFIATPISIASLWYIG